MLTFQHQADSYPDNKSIVSTVLKFSFGFTFFALATLTIPFEDDKYAET